VYTLLGSGSSKNTILARGKERRGFLSVALGFYSQENSRGLLEPPLGANEEVPRVGVKSVVPYLVWPNQVGHQLTSASRRRLAGGPFGPW
jgi:hypothetical protein